MDMGQGSPRPPLPPNSTLREAAERALRARLGAVADRLPLAASTDGDTVSAVHKLRVSTRKASAALDLFQACIRPKDYRRSRRTLKKIRRAAGAVRDMDVLAALLARARKKAPAELHPAVDALTDLAGAERARAAERLIEVADKYPRNRLRRQRRRLLQNLHDSHAGDAETPETFSHAGRLALTGMLSDLAAAGAADLSDLERLHAVRLAGKRLRYALDIYGVGADAEPLREFAQRLEEMQEALGAINDSHQMVSFAQRALAPPADDAKPALPLISPALRESVETLIQRWQDHQAARQAAFIEWWEGFRALGKLDEFARTLHTPPAPPRPPSLGAPLTTGDAAPAQPGGARPWRIAAIDVGTNSIRLIVAEAFPDGSYRVLDDEREIARLGRGLASTGALNPEAIELAVTVIDHMRRIAEGYSVDRLRVVGTAAVREASNGAEFRDRLRERTGLSIEVIDAQQEARLAYTSAAHAFDLRALPSAVVDIGGGSTEIVLSSGPVIEQVYAVPLGAVRLTEMFGGPDRAAGKRFDAMRRYIRKVVHERVKDVPFPPQLLVGSGGTFEAMAKLAMHERSGRAATPTVRGYDMSRADVRRALDRLRQMSMKERLRVPGLSEQRAEIIVAGAALMHRVMKRLGADRMRVNDGGIRDGILLAMISEHFADAALARERRAAPRGAEPADSRARAQMRAVQRFAGACNYERKHCYHVAGLALSLFDQINADARLAAAAESNVGSSWRSPDARVLLEAASILHDCGYHINYARHHLHSYHLIMHSDMAGFTRREIEIVANVARYHRGPEPKGKHDNLAELPRADRGLVRALGGILRVADGLDRTHMQNVVALRLAPGEQPGHARLTVQAAADPAVDIWGSQRKAGLFEDTFGVRLEYAWSEQPAPGAAGSAPTGARSANAAPITESSHARAELA